MNWQAELKRIKTASEDKTALEVLYPIMNQSDPQLSASIYCPPMIKKEKMGPKLKKLREQQGVACCCESAGKTGFSCMWEFFLLIEAFFMGDPFTFLRFLLGYQMIRCAFRLFQEFFKEESDTEMRLGIRR